MEKEMMDEKSMEWRAKAGVVNGNRENRIENINDHIRKATMVNAAKILLIGAPSFVILLFGYFYIVAEAPFPIATLLVVSTLALILFHFIRGIPLHLGRFRKSRHTYHLVSMFVELNIIALAYIPFSVRLVLDEYPTQQTLFFFFLLPVGFFLLYAIVFMVIMLHSKTIGEFPSPYSFSNSLPRHMDVGIKDSNAFQDGYSDRPWSVEIAIPQPERFREFAEMLMHNLVILDYTEERRVKKDGDEKESGGRLKLFFFPMNLVDRIRVQFSRNDSFLNVDPATGQATIHFPAKEYNAIYAPVSYHLLCENIVKRIMTSYDFYLKDDEEALNVFRHSWKNLDETGGNESLFRPEENQGSDKKKEDQVSEDVPGWKIRGKRNERGKLLN